MFKIKRLDNRGFYLSMTATAVFLLSALLIFLLMPQLSRMISASRDTQDTIEKMVWNRNQDERLSALIGSNPSFIGLATYSDDYEDVLITEVESIYTPVSTNSSTFEIKNATDLDIIFNAVPAEGFSVNYQADLRYEGVVVASAVGDQISLSSIDFYNPMTGDTNYGEYSIDVTEYDGTSVTHTASYDKLVERTVNVVIENRDPRDIYFNFE